MTLYDKTYCAKSHKDCDKTECPRHLRGFWGMYISISNDFDCEEELKNNRKLEE